MQKFILTSFFILISSIACAFETDAKYAVLMDYDTKTVLFEKEAHAHMAPSSMSKMMTAYIAFEKLKSGQVKLSDVFPTSEKSWRMGGTRMFIPLNAEVQFEDLLKGLIIQSGNDAAVSIAEILAGSEEEFTDIMNETAEKLGMKDTHFTNASGWPDENNYSSAYDLALLSYHTIKDYPEYYHYYSQIEYTYNDIKQGNRNGLLYRNMGADGLKTGHADEAGYGVAASVKRGDRRLIAVVNGLKSNKDRTTAAEQIMNYGMMSFSNINIAQKNQVIDKIKVANGKLKEIELVALENITIVLPKNESRNLKTMVHYNVPAVAPLKAGDILGELIVETKQYGNVTYPLAAKESVEKAGFFDRVKKNLESFF